MRNFRNTIYILIQAILAASSLCRCGTEESQPGIQRSYEIKTEEDLQSMLGHLGQEPDDHRALTAVWWYYTAKGQYNQLIGHALSVYRRAAESDNEEIKAYAGTYLAQAYLSVSQYDSVRIFLDGVSDILEKRHMKDLMTIVHNTWAIYAIQVEMDYAKALDHFREALELSKEAGNRTDEGLLLCNIASIYLMRKDISGLPYAEEAYALSIDRNDEFIRVYGAMLLAQMYCLAEEYDRALIYADELMKLSRIPLHERHRPMAHVIMGDIADATGDADKAGYYYSEALRLSPEYPDENTMTRIYLGYGNFLLHSNQARKARDIFDEGLSISLNRKNIESRHDLLLGLSKAYHALGDKDKALEYYQMYHIHSDSLQNLHREQEFNQLLLRYEKVNHQKEIREKELGLMKANRRMQLIAYILIVVVVVLGSIFILYRRKNRMYRQLVSKHQQLVNLEKNLQSKEKEPPAEDQSEKKFYCELESLMKEERIYRDNDISLEKIAERLGTNRYTISRIINHYSGMSFYNYINSYRMQEAVATLSDPENDIPLKALSQDLGYNALSAFYRSFQKETGVPPSRYREEVRRMQRGNKASSIT